MHKPKADFTNDELIATVAHLIQRREYAGGLTSSEIASHLKRNVKWVRERLQQIREDLDVGYRRVERIDRMPGLVPVYRLRAGSEISRASYEGPNAKRKTTSGKKQGRRGRA